jgi:hypothetical protein
MGTRLHLQNWGVLIMEYTKHQLVALNTFLACWPDGLSYASVLQRLDNDDLYRTESDDDGINAGNDDIDPRGTYQGFDPAELAILIADLHDHLAQVYGEG